MPRIGALPLTCCCPAAAHFILNVPVSRNGLACDGHPCETPREDVGIANGGNTRWSGQSWFTNNVTIQKPILTSAEHREYLTQCQGFNTPEYKDCDWTWTSFGADGTLDKPWRAPGTGVVATPCGLINGSSTGSEHIDGKTLDPVPREQRATWTLGGTAEVAFGISTNHGGGYSYRLCPAHEPLTEACFQRTPLRFADNTTDIVDTAGVHIGFVGSVRLSQGTFPEGSEWTRNPIPLKARNFPAPFGLVGSPHQINVLDRVQVPSDLAPGDYVLSFRLDCEQRAEIWSNCADIRIESAASDAVSV